MGWNKVVAMLIILILSSTMSLAVVDHSIGTASAEVYNNFQYSLIKDGTEIQIYGYMGLDSNIVIPSTIDGKPVTSLYNNVFRTNEYIQTVYLPDSITDIGYGVFSICKNLRSIHIPSHMTYIPELMFAGCTSITSITIPNSVTTIGDNAFEYCDSLTSITFPNSVTTIRSSAFQDCYSLTSLSIPDSVTSMESYCFAGCTALTSVRIGNGLTSISDYAFNNCGVLSSFSMGSHVTSIGQQAFQLTAIKDLPFTGGVTTIGNYAFGDCYEMRSVTIPSSVTTIGERAFANDGQIKTITFEGNAPSLSTDWVDSAPWMSPTIYYHPGATGFSTPTWNGLACYPLTATAPTAPQSLSAVAGDSQISLSWATPSSDGGAPIDYYLVYLNGVASSNQYASTDAIISGLANGQSYQFSVAAHNVAGLGEKSSSIAATPIARTTTPGVPSGLTATPGNGKVSLSWNSPNNGGAAIDYYVVYQNDQDIAHVFGTTKVISGLSNGVTYSYAVAAHNSAGVGIKCMAMSATPTASATEPNAPTGLTAMPGDGQVSLSWAAPSSDGGTAIDYYAVYQNDQDIAHVRETTKVIRGLTNGQSYTFAVAAHNDIGTGAKSDSVTAVPSKSATVPSSPRDLVAIPGSGQIQLSWAPPANNGGADIASYLLSWSQDQNSAYTPISVSGTSYLHSGLELGRTYYYKVSAINSVGESEATAIVSATTVDASLLPEAPTDLKAIVNDTSVDLCWNAPASSPTSPITEYMVYRGTSENDLTRIATVDGTSYVDTNTESGVRYTYKVVAANNNGIGIASEPVDVTIEAHAATSSSIPTEFVALGIVGTVATAGVTALLLNRRRSGNW